MQILKPIIHETIWGGSRLSKYVSNASEQIGHLYACIDQGNLSNQIVDGDFAGKTVHSWFLANRKRYGLEDFNELPVLMALVDASDNLSVQVHPDDYVAKEHLDKPFGKNESFFILEPPRSSKMINGCKVEKKSDVARLISEGLVLDALDYLPLSKGDCVYVEGGTLHAATAGMLSFEIEENCDSTFRFYDFDRVDSLGKKRPLQIEDALLCLDPRKKSKVVKFDSGNKIQKRFYTTQFFKSGGLYQNRQDEFVIAVLLSGEANLRGHAIFPGAAVILQDNDVLDMQSNDWMIVWVHN